MTDKQSYRLSVAPMMDWTDSACRRFHRLLSRRALLYTEMVTAAAVIHGDRARLLDHDAAEHPVALQLGGSDPAELRQATRIAADWGYDEINLNVGCPSDRVQSGCFGAVLMKAPQLVAECVAAMQAVSPVEVTVKCRIGVDDQDPGEVLPGFVATMRAAGIRRMTIHARKAWLKGLSPRENREVPPLDYDLVHAMKRAFPDMHLSINGGIADMDMVRDQLRIMDGVMVGRAAYHQPWAILGAADALWGAAPPFADPVEAAQAMRPIITEHLSQGGRLHHFARHMLGLFHGRPGARGWKRTLSEGAAKGGIEVYDAALAQVQAAGNEALASAAMPG
ncbi:tRNA dihydrouridine(20/20a) synthase DusA [Paracoccus bogoriensis]|uniref:tRNA dihydrouridine(20/20a) synthase DusA n=1 Tax=Paracoccus bogoriensis TaxID=242065 RepID=UPI001CA5DC8C|nr:tRNA dihydrouridine(20/20a) synthase DusA [Paracoccus bogoriensis]MBW7057128.1 tRNA dihydrouridine(20/20a) synthase DusA [Paracoccus bogoriensis]